MKQLLNLAFFLFILIILHLVISLLNNLIKNMESNLHHKEGFNPKCNITNATSRIGKAMRCQGATIEKTKLTSINREGKIKELENIVKKTRMQVQKNKKDILANLFASKQLSNVANDKDEDTSAACKSYPEAC